MLLAKTMSQKETALGESGVHGEASSQTRARGAVLQLGCGFLQERKFLLELGQSPGIWQ